ncbi:hypothetical protein H0A66_05315 [Alcaligenaceae bacterium]|nr:hypothetical protein [Alcaligenaceae bacterium]
MLHAKRSSAALVAASVPAPWPEALPALNIEAFRGTLFDDSRVLSKLIGRSTTPLQDSVATALKAA